MVAVISVSGGKLALAAQAERNRLAREIHDGLGHHLSVLAVHLEGARHLVGEDPGRASQVLERFDDTRLPEQMAMS